MGERIYTAEDAEALAAAATPGPYIAGAQQFRPCVYPTIGGGVDVPIADDIADHATARLFAAAPDLARSVAHHARRAAALEAEVRRLRAHNMRMSRAWEAIADACHAAGPGWWEHECGLLDVVNGLPGNDYKGTAAACRALARGEVSDG